MSRENNVVLIKSCAVLHDLRAFFLRDLLFFIFARSLMWVTPLEKVFFLLDLLQPEALELKATVR